eukprot:CAMPEP_0177780832 /NCGR_PEP_ID=MMETSP0491_2-20121128/17470_1 /TAXON_ID=63592 /ORGANISM="Tetraselmis chuii, Strain PLY429" /LENGTH=123 /DNA_ID=CAMNT_0019300743 /DNA_START=139 /DNA_END=509 /DNA_ORIENTATION=+
MSGHPLSFYLKIAAAGFLVPPSPPPAHFPTFPLPFRAFTSRRARRSIPSREFCNVAKELADGYVLVVVQVGGAMEGFMLKTGFYNIVTRLEAEKIEENLEQREEFLRKLQEQYQQQQASKAQK